VNGPAVWTLCCACSCLLVLACSPGAAAPCRVEFSLGPDGHCYPPPDDPSVTDVLYGLPDCVLAAPTDEISLDAGCANPVCAADIFAAMDEALGGAPDCRAMGTSRHTCSWNDAIEGTFPNNEAADGPYPQGRTDTLTVLPGYDGTTVGGLAVGIATRCFVEVLGVPTRIVWVDVEGTLTAEELRWDAYGLDVYDEEAEVGSHPDGTVDRLRLAGAAQ